MTEILRIVQHTPFWVFAVLEHFPSALNRQGFPNRR